jgi:hypothetical protein
MIWGTVLVVLAQIGHSPFQNRPLAQTALAGSSLNAGVGTVNGGARCQPVLYPPTAQPQTAALARADCARAVSFGRYDFRSFGFRTQQQATEMFGGRWIAAKEAAN